MIKYKISSENPQSHFLNIEMVIDNIQSDSIELQLPAWRPGRYELQNFAKNIQRFEVFSSPSQRERGLGGEVSFHKLTKDRWLIHSPDLQEITVKFTYFANVQNAGSSYVDESIMYVNFVNCLPYVEGRMDEECELEIAPPAPRGGAFEVACGLTPSVPEGEISSSVFFSPSGGWGALVDSPLLASPYLQHQSYQVENVDFHVWFLGNYTPNWTKLLADFQAFTEKQIQVMGDFPEKDYHFINWILPTSFYHGVEHRNSTMIVLGPDSEGDGLYNDLLGVSSHELYHAWNICKIRPVEMMPYDFTKENYFPTGFVAEGVTTYYGDLFLVQSGVFTQEQYLKELETILKRHFEQDGKAFQSLVESSFDLWLDGYVQAIPHRRVSIYQKGAVVSLILDLMIRLRFGHQKSLETIMETMWERFGKESVGYSITDYQRVCEEVYGRSLSQYFKDCIHGNMPLESMVNELLEAFGLQMQWNEEGKIHLELLEADNENLKLWLNL
jgi:predicted metalloprotease with PDZ domain